MKDNRPLYEQAYDDYKKGLKTKDIAVKYNVSEATVRSWKSRYWNKKALQQNNDSVATNKKRCNEKRTRGAPAGNKNAVGNPGGGAPEGSQNNYKHGIYEKLRFAMLSPEEQELLTDIDSLDMEAELRRTIRECDLNILKYHQMINEIRAKPGGIYAHSTSKRSVVFKSKKDEQESNGKDSGVDTIQTNTMNIHDLILRYSNELHKWEGKRIRCLETLLKHGFDNERFELEKKKFEKDGNGDGNMGMLVATIESARKQRGDKK